MGGGEEVKNPLPPPLKWAGGKRWLIPRLKAIYEPHRHQRLVEPFAGSLAVALGLMPERALLNDINPHLINFYRWLKRGLSASLPMRYDRETYYRYRERFNAIAREGGIHSEEAALLFYKKRGCEGAIKPPISMGGYTAPPQAPRTLRVETSPRNAL